MTNKSELMTIEDVAEYVENRGVSPKRFWGAAAGGDMHRMTREQADDIIALLSEEADDDEDVCEHTRIQRGPGPVPEGACADCEAQCSTDEVICNDGECPLHGFLSEAT